MFTPQDSQSIFDHFSTLWMQRVNLEGQVRVTIVNNFSGH